jgi:hypothetical protein
MHTLTLANSLFFLSLPMQTDQRDSPAYLFKAQHKILPEIDPCPIWLDRREEGEPETKPYQDPSPSPFCSTKPTPNGRSPLLLDSSPNPTSQRHHSSTPRSPRASPWPPWMPRLVKTPLMPPRAIISPPTSPSPQRPIPRDALPQTHRTPCPDHARPMSLGHPECAARVSCSRAPAPRPTLLSTHTCTASTCRRNTTLALHRRAPTRARSPPFRLCLL